MTDEELKQPGVAWELAKQALAAGNLEEADRLRKYMEKSDSGLMLARIMDERQRLVDAANANGNAFRTKEK